MRPASRSSFAARRVVEAPVETLLGDGMACRKPDAEALAIILANVERIVEVTDAELADGDAQLFAHDAQRGRRRRRRGVRGRVARARDRSPGSASASR